MEIAQQIGDRGSEAYAAVFQGRVAMNHGHMEEALALFRRARAATEATGIPYMQALGLCVTGTCYQRIGVDVVDRALDYHDQTLEMMELPTGTTLGAWLWAEVGHCALAAGKVDDAKELFDKALTEKTAPMYLARPSAMMGQVEVALAEGRPEDATAIAAELDEYVSTREMRDLYEMARFATARVAAAAGDHATALDKLAECESAVTDAGMRRFALDVVAARAASLEALERHEDAATVRDRGRSLAHDIAKSMQDESLRSAFLASSEALLSPAQSVAPGAS